MAKLAATLLHASMSFCIFAQNTDLKTMIKEFLIVGGGSFMGGGLRYVVCKLSAAFFPTLTFPLGTFIVNVVGCFLIGILSGLNWSQSVVSENTRLLLTTGFCGGFTTFSTFMNENAALFRDGNFLTLSLYSIGSLAAGFLFIFLGNYLVKQI